MDINATGILNLPGDLLVDGFLTLASGATGTTPAVLMVELEGLSILSAELDQLST